MVELDFGGVKEAVITRNEFPVDKNDYVWFGKIGSTISETRIKALNKQVNNGISTYIYLVKGNRKKSTAYCAKLLLASKELPKGEEEKTPSYYSTEGIRQYMKAWVKIGEISEIEMSSMKNLRAINSIFPIQETLVRSSSGYFLVYEAKDTF